MNQRISLLHTVQYIEDAIIAAILDGTYAPGALLPNERDYAAQLQVTRPTLREALQRLASDGWITIRHGKSTLVNDYWQTGGLRVLSTLLRANHLTERDLIPALLEVRAALSPAIVVAAMRHDAQEIVEFLQRFQDLPDNPAAYAAFDWQLHLVITHATGNPVFTLLFNEFDGIYESLARIYFALPVARASSLAFYADLLAALRDQDVQRAEQVARDIAQMSIHLWKLSIGDVTQISALPIERQIDQ